VEGWMVPVSRVNASGSIQLKIWHFSGIQAAIVSSAADTDNGGDKGGGDETPDDVANCFINNLGYAE
jgi:hypothetical protein